MTNLVRSDTSKLPITVEKIGGTSMSRFSEIIDNVILHDSARVLGRVYVVSAYGGVTDLLLEHKKTGAPGVYTRFAERGDYLKALEDLRGRLLTINRQFESIGLDIQVADAFISERLDGVIRYLASMNDVLASGYVAHAELLSAARELLASVGESHSAFNSGNILARRGYPVSVIDLSGWGDSRELTIDQRIQEAFTGIDPRKQIIFTTGYSKGTEGIMREFDRGYSEVVFSKIAVLLPADEAIIHKEYHLSSADPAVVGVQRVRPVCSTNFDVADQLADVGMEAIHPKAAKPVELAGIPLRIKNAFEPGHDGTLITRDYVCPDSKLEIIAGSKSVSLLEIHDARMVAEVGSDLRIMEVLVRHGLSYISKTTNANTIDLILWEDELGNKLLSELRGMFRSVEIHPVAIVCAIGSNIAKPGILARAAQALANAGVNIINVAQTARQTNMQFVVGRVQFVTAQRALHDLLCET